jgi:hypothetical protein
MIFRFFGLREVAPDHLGQGMVLPEYSYGISQRGLEQ